MAVIIALVAVTILTILAGAFALSMKVETHLAAYSNNDEKLLWMGRAGMQLACLKLTQENNLPYDSMNMRWAGGPGIGAITNADPIPDPYPLGDGSITVKIIDLERKININAAAPDLLQSVLQKQNVDASQISVISDCIADWIDPDDVTRPAGAESDYYQGKPIPYNAKNAPMDDISELMLIKGITPKMFDGSGQENTANGGIPHHQLGVGHTFSGEADYTFTDVDVFTPFGSGKVNINTASSAVLQTLPMMDSDTADAIVRFRAGPDGQEGTDDDTPFQNVNMISASGIPQQNIGPIMQFITTKSTTFEVHVTATIGDQKREFIGIIFRNGRTPQVVEFYWQ
ncbi:MAG TPA: general secretion pathway protein GspK [Verrucomicrobiae bacterium]